MCSCILMGSRWSAQFWAACTALAPPMPPTTPPATAPTAPSNGAVTISPTPASGSPRAVPAASPSPPNSLAPIPAPTSPPAAGATPCKAERAKTPAAEVCSGCVSVGMYCANGLAARWDWPPPTSSLFAVTPIAAEASGDPLGIYCANGLSGIIAHHLKRRVVVWGFHCHHNARRAS